MINILMINCLFFEILKLVIYYLIIIRSIDKFYRESHPWAYKENWKKDGSGMK